MYLLKHPLDEPAALRAGVARLTRLRFFRKSERANPAGTLTQGIGRSLYRQHAVHRGEKKTLLYRRPSNRILSPVFGITIEQRKGDKKWRLQHRCNTDIDERLYPRVCFRRELSPVRKIIKTQVHEPISCIS